VVVQGPLCKEFEYKWCNYTGAKIPFAVQAVQPDWHLVLSALGIKAGDEVIVLLLRGLPQQM